MIKTFKDLIVWQKSISLILKIYRITDKYPKSEIYNIIIQIRKAAVSVPSNIAEGFGRRTSREWLRFLNISMGSLYELQTLFYISKELKYIDTIEYHSFESKLLEIERMMSSLIEKLQTRLKNKCKNQF